MSERRHYYLPLRRVHEDECSAPEHAGIYIKVDSLLALLEMEASVEEQRTDNPQVRAYIAARLRHVGQGIARAAVDYDVLQPPSKP